MPNPKEMHSIDSATLVIGKDTGKDNERQVDAKELKQTDKAFIADSVVKGLSLETTYLGLTEHRLSKGRPRILKRLVEDEYKAVAAQQGADVICPISGLKAKAG